MTLPRPVLLDRDWSRPVARRRGDGGVRRRFARTSCDTPTRANSPKKASRAEIIEAVHARRALMIQGQREPPAVQQPMRQSALSLDRALTLAPRPGSGRRKRPV
jgi:hypothetical protein